MNRLEWLRKRNRTLLELRAGIVFLGVLLLGIGLFFVQDKGRYAGSVCFGVFGALAASAHMYLCLNKALDYDPKTAQKKIYSGYLIRYFFIVAVFVAICITDALRPIVVFMAYMTLKVAALLQPFTHKFFNYLFSETDPVAMPLIEEEVAEKVAIRQEGNQEISDSCIKGDALAFQTEGESL